MEAVIEGIGIPKYRGNDLRVPFQHGNRWIKKRFDSRKVVLSMWIKGTDRADLDGNIDAFLTVIGKPGWVQSNGTRRAERKNRPHCH